MFRRIFTLALVALALLAAPASAQYDPNTGCGTIAVAGAVSVDADGTPVVRPGSDGSVAMSNLLPGSTVTVTVGGLTVRTFTVPAAGEFTGSFVVPAGLADGTYVVTATGTHESGSSDCGASTTIRVAAATTNPGGGGSVSVPNPDSVDADGTPVVQAGSQATVTQSGLLPGSTVTVSIDNQVVGSSVVNASGEINMTVTIPAGVYPGSYAIVATGTNADGSDFTASQDVRVARATQGGTTTGNDTTTTGGGNPSGSLAFTGSTAAPLAGAATVLIVLGAVMLLARKPEANS